MMSRTLAMLGSASLVLLSAVLISALLISGCGTKKKSAGSSNDSANKPAPPTPLLKGWNKPAVALVLSGDQYGYLEPCGCTAENQLGGLEHRADLFRKLREQRGWDVAALDLGGLVTKNPRNSDVTDLRIQDRIKLQKTLEALKILGYQAVGLGTRELRLALPQNDTFLAALSNLLPGDTGEVPFVSANAAFVARDASGNVVQKIGPRVWHVFSVDGTTIGVTSVIGKRSAESLVPEGFVGPLDIRDAQPALSSALNELKGEQPDLLVLLSYAEIEESRRFAESFPQFDLVLTAGGPEDGLDQPERIGNTLMVNVGTKGKHVGVVGYYPDASESPLTFELVALDADRFGSDARMHDIMDAYQQTLKTGPELTHIFEDSRLGPHPTGRQFVGVESCKECHKKAYAKWITTKHSHAYKSLIEGRPGMKDDWIPRNYDPECLACHVTGWDPSKVRRYDSGFLVREIAEQNGRPKLYTGLKGQQCENCHGPGSRHVKLEWELRKNPVGNIPENVRQERLVMQLRKETVKEQRTCYKCHDLDNSPNFDFDKYWPEIEHKGKD